MESAVLYNKIGLWDRYWKKISKKVINDKCLKDFQEKVYSLLFARIGQARMFTADEFEWLSELRNASLIVPVGTEKDDARQYFRVRHDLFLSYIIARSINLKLRQKNLTHSEFKEKVNNIIKSKDSFSFSLIGNTLEFLLEMADEYFLGQITQNDSEQAGKFQNDIQRMLELVKKNSQSNNNRK